MPPSVMVRTALRSMEDLVRSESARNDGRIAALEDKMERCFGQYQEVVGMLLRGMVSNNRDKDVKDRIHLKLAPMKHIYSGLFYNRMFGMVFVTTFKDAIEKGASSETDEDNYLPIINSTSLILHALVFRRLLSERTASGVARSSVHRLGGQFRLDLCMAMIGTAQSNDRVGVQAISTENGREQLPRPSWLRRGYVQKADIHEVVLRCEDTTVKRSDTAVALPKNNMDYETGLLWEESVERKLLVEEIVKRLHQRHVQHLNRARDSVRGEFFTALGFLWHSQMQPKYHLEVYGPITMDLTSIPSAYIPKDGDTDTIRRKNLASWKDFVSNHVREMELIVEYRVTVFEKRPFTNRVGEERTLVRRINFLLVALKFCTRFVASYKTDDFFALHTASFQVVFAVACVFREMFIQFRESGCTLPITDKDGTWGEDEHSINTLVLDLVPSFIRTQKSILEEQVLRLSTHEFESLHQDMSVATEIRGRDYSADNFISQEDRGGDPSEAIEDRCIASMKSFDFST